MKIALVRDYDERPMANRAIPGDNPDASMPLISAPTWKLSGEADAVLLQHGSRLAEIYPGERIDEDHRRGFAT